MTALLSQLLLLSLSLIGANLPSSSRFVPLTADHQHPAFSIRGGDHQDDSYAILTRGGQQEDESGYTILKEEVKYDNWRRVIIRRVRFPSLQQVDFEVVSQKGTDKAVLIFVWNTSTKTATLLREYMPSVHKVMTGLAAGMVEDDKHGHADDDCLTAAEHELEEECLLTGGKWFRVTGEDVTMDKYSTTKLSVYLVIDPVPIAADQAKPRDETEEGMEVLPGVTVEEILQMIHDGDMTVVGGWACLLALQKLREMGEIE